MADIDVQMEGIVEPTYNKRRKGYVFKKDGLEIFIKGEDKEEAMKQMAELMEEKQEKEENDDTVTFAEGGMPDGGLKDEGGSVDPVSGNDVPVGSTQKEVRDDIPAQLSEGEFVLPADVVRYIGLENLMELRQKAKQGLAQMEAMGQMGNSEEATMDDTADMEVDIDALIDQFDPNDPETQSFAEGGMLTYQYQPAQNIYSPTANFNPYSSQTGQQQQFSFGYMPQTTYTPPPIPTANAARMTSATPTGGRVEQRQYIGPNGEMRTFTFIDGKPTEEIPAGFKVFKAEEQKAPEVAAPTVAPRPESGDGGEDRSDERDAQYAGWRDTMGKLAQLDEEFAGEWSKSPHNPNNPTGLRGLVESGGFFGAIKNDFGLNTASQAALDRVAQNYGLNVENYKNDFTFFGLDKFNEDALVRDAFTAKTVADSLSRTIGRDVDPRDLARTDLDRDGDGRVEQEDLVDKSGRLTQQGLDLFNIESEDADPGDTRSATRDDFDRQTQAGLGIGPGRQSDMLTDQDAGLFDTPEERAAFYGESTGDGRGGIGGSDFGSSAERDAVADSGWGSDAHFDSIDAQFDANDSGDSGNDSGRYCCSRMVHHDLWTVEREFARLSAWSRKQPKWWRSGYPVWGKVVAKHLLGKQGFWTDVMQAFYDNHVMKKPRTLKSTLADVIIFPGSFVCGMIWKDIPSKATLADPREFN